MARPKYLDYSFTKKENDEVGKCLRKGKKCTVEYLISTLRISKERAQMLIDAIPTIEGCIRIPSIRKRRYGNYYKDPELVKKQYYHKDPIVDTFIKGKLKECGFCPGTLLMRKFKLSHDEAYRILQDVPKRPRQHYEN